MDYNGKESSPLSVLPGRVVAFGNKRDAEGEGEDGYNGLKPVGRVAVAGGANIDIGGRATGHFALHDSNPGVVKRSPGGVARNIAHNLALLGVSVKLFTALGDDPEAAYLAESCEQNGIGLITPDVSGGRTSAYLYLTDADGEMVGAVSDTGICDRLTPAFFESHLEEIQACDALVIDTNLPVESVRYLAGNAGVPVFADPVSAAKSGKLEGVLGFLHTLKPNRLEAARLSGIAIGEGRRPETEKEAEAAADALLAKGVGHVYLSLGAQGVLAADAERKIWIPAITCDARNLTGAGDAFMAGLVYAYTCRMAQGSAGSTASACAAVAAESEEPVNPALSAARVRKMTGG